MFGFRILNSPMKMSAQFTRDHVKITVAKILQTLGWHSINTTPLEILTDILHNYLFQLSKLTNEYANEFGFTKPNLDHLGLTFREMGISLPELEEYVKYVNFGATPALVSKFPVSKEDQLNFLKPGSKEVVTRPVHIHEHLPPMNPILEDGAVIEKETVPQDVVKMDESSPDNQPVFRKPTDVPSVIEFKKFKRDEEGSRPTREISSVMMTTSGFLSPAREGKLPEAKTPIAASTEPPPQPVAQINIAPNSEQPDVPVVKKPSKPIKKIEKKSDKLGKELFKGNHEHRVKKNHSKEILKMKQIKAFANASALLSGFPQGLDVVKLPPIPHNNKMNYVKLNNKALQAARMKTEKLNTTITPLPMKPLAVNSFPTGSQLHIDHVDKLLNVPDKKKVNILKKISNVKEKTDDNKAFIKKEDIKEDPGSPPDLIIDEPEDMIPKLAHLRSDITIEPINPPVYSESNIKAEPTYYDDSPPGTPLTPKTPEMMPAVAPVVIKEKKKRKPKIRKVLKQELQSLPYGSFNEAEAMVERPKTPKAEVDISPQQHIPVPSPQTSDFPFGNLNSYHLGAGRPNIHFLANFGGPGLIPPPLGNPLNPLSNPLFPNPFPLLNLSDFGQNPYLAQNLPPLSNHLTNFLPKAEEMPSSSTSVSEAVNLPPPRTPEPVTSTTLKPEKSEKKSKEHKKEKKDKLKKKAKKEKLKAKAEKKEEKKKIKKKEKREKRKEKEVKEESAVPKLTLKLKSPSPRPVTPDTTTKKLNIKPVVKIEVEVFEEPDSEMSSLAKISALVTGPPKQKTIAPPVVPALNENYCNPYAISKKKHKPEHKPIPKLKVEIKKEPIFELPPTPPSKYIDAQGKEVWICPGCSRQDDGSPMIGCDGCDAWYHWVCVGIQVPPDENEDWYCRHCLLKKDEDLQSDKKKKRKRKEKKEHQ
ncbi:hypothetical protein HHI36_022795 [Cryptolaemus montrouzieri]|uniref:PHD-type domain-containing protein n=1 Tax=Cryptolaemus montrouzieri TaxID=559131 RepID=A0ABD2PEZ9_9CUCU